MNTLRFWIACAFTALFCGSSLRAEVKVTFEHIDNDHALAGFNFKTIPVPVRGDAATKATFTLTEGEPDENCGGLEKLHDGSMPTEADQPAANFFFNQATDSGRILIDLGTPIEIRQINTYSWHTDTRAPQVYKLYANDADGAVAEAQQKGADLEKKGWKQIASVDTRKTGEDPGGQYGVSISDPAGIIGKFRYLVFVISKTEDADPFGNTFYSEIDVLDKNAPIGVEHSIAAETSVENFVTLNGGYQFSIMTADAPDLADWARISLAPAVQKWYPMIAKMLSSDGYEAPKKFTIKFTNEYKGVAATAGTHIECSPDWYRHNLKGEAVGSVIHELVHVVQQYGQARRRNPNAARAPGWLVEGIPDYIRWYLFEPQSHGAEIPAEGLSRARFDGSYRVTANFLNWATGKYDKELVPKLNVALREGTYSDETWRKLTNHSIQELGDEWKKALSEKLGLAQTSTPKPPPPAPSTEQTTSPSNSLTDAEKAAGWILLFNGQNMDGWHNFKAEGIGPGWQVKDGVMICADPHSAGDIVTNEKFDWFELQLDYNITPDGDSGILYHVTDEGQNPWFTGLEYQLEDNARNAEEYRSGCLYGLYRPPVDPNSGYPLDATKPVGEWNHVRLVVSPEKCEHYMNGVKYFDYVIGSEDFNQRVKQSKFATLPNFAKSNSGYICLQGHQWGVSFRYIKILRIEPKK